MAIYKMLVPRDHSKLIAMANKFSENEARRDIQRYEGRKRRGNKTTSRSRSLTAVRRDTFILNSVTFNTRGTH